VSSSPPLNGDDNRFVVQGVHMLIENNRQRRRRPNEARKPTRFHQPGLPSEALKRGV
jgi:hypothetical protein